MHDQHCHLRYLQTFRNNVYAFIYVGRLALGERNFIKFRINTPYLILSHNLSPNWTTRSTHFQAGERDVFFNSFKIFKG
jgi:hypothetical protein